MSALFLTGDLMLASKAAGASARTGVAVGTAGNVAALLEKATQGGCELVLLDLSTAGCDPLDIVGRLQATPQPPATIIAFGPHVQEERLEAARQAGCDLVLSRGQFNAQLDEILIRYCR